MARHKLNLNLRKSHWNMTMLSKAGYRKNKKFGRHCNASFKNTSYMR